MRTPPVTVLMPVHNGEPYLGEALDSILAQTYSGFELLVVDDGSTDSTPGILAACRDPRVKVVRNEANLGVVAALNRGLALARGEYVARMDADDVAEPNRLALQAGFMDANPDVWLCGSWYRIWSPGTGTDELVRIPLDHATLKASMLFVNPLSHPSVMFRRRKLRDSDLWYDADFPHAEDYELWTRILSIPGARIAAVPKPLIRYRWHGGNVSKRNVQAQYDASVRIRQRLLAGLGLNPGADLLAIHECLVRGEAMERPDFPALVEAWTACLLAASRHASLYDERALSAVLDAAKRNFFQHEPEKQGMRSAPA